MANQLIETPEQRFNKLREECWNKSIDSCALSYIFNKRAIRFNRNVNLLKVFGIIVPTSIGATVMGYGINNLEYLQFMIVIAVPITIIQLVFSVFAVIYKWDDELAYSYEASHDLDLLFDKFRNIANLPPQDYSELNKEYSTLNTFYNVRSQQNSKHNLKEWELRMGMRYSLREHQRACAGCKQVPISMESTECPVCGNFNFINKL